MILPFISRLLMVRRSLSSILQIAWRWVLAGILIPSCLYSSRSLTATLWPFFIFSSRINIQRNGLFTSSAYLTAISFCSSSSDEMTPSEDEKEKSRGSASAVCPAAERPSASEPAIEAFAAPPAPFWSVSTSRTISARRRS